MSVKYCISSEGEADGFSTGIGFTAIVAEYFDALCTDAIDSLMVGVGFTPPPVEGEASEELLFRNPALKLI
jgi:hypothetical protein